MDIKQEMIEYRGRNGLPMAKAAAEAGITIQTWMNVERGIQTPSRLTEAKILAVIRKEER